MPEIPVHQEPYSNPIAPPDQDAAADKKNHLTNEDFRKLLATPRPAPSPSAPPSSDSSHSKHKPASRRDRELDEEKKKKKAVISKIRKEEEERQAEWAKRYRDRAKERRDGSNPDYAGTDDVAPTTSGYKAVAPDIDPSIMAERRKQAIQESKFLGGDMEHTHLVKGLDYALLQKVRSEIQHQQHEVAELHLLEKKREREKARGEVDEDIQCRTKMAKNISRILFHSKSLERNELFLPGRMAYVFELEDEYAESDIPTTLIRSKADCPTMEAATLSTNDIVINKLTQILSYLRQGARAGGKKGKKRDKGKGGEEPLKKLPQSDDRIFDDAGEYVFDPKAHAAASAAKEGKTSYFGQAVKEEKESEEDIRKSATEFVKTVSQKYGSQKFSTEEEKLAAGWAPADFQRVGQEQTAGAGGGAGVGAATAKKGAGKKKKERSGFGGFDMEHYAECYPGGMEEFDATYDSDEDADYSKMDMGNKKGPMKRWDFDTDEDYQSYQSRREALPKAAFQFGVKMSEGRKTRRFGGGMTEKAREKAKLNREWQQISALIQKRKGGPSGGGGRSEGSEAKRSKLE